MGEADSQGLLETVGNTERGESNRKLRMTESQSVSVICLGVCKQNRRSQNPALVQLVHHHCVTIKCVFVSFWSTVTVMGKIQSYYSNLFNCGKFWCYICFTSLECVYLCRCFAGSDMFSWAGPFKLFSMFTDDFGHDSKLCTVYSLFFTLLWWKNGL